MKLINNKAKSFVSILLILTIIVTFITGCSSNSAETSKEPDEPKTKIITDSFGRQVEIPTKIEKVVNVGAVGVLNCFMFAMGEGDKIANNLPPRFQSYTWRYHTIMYPAIADKPMGQEVEEVLEINPDIVFTMDKKTAEDFSQKGLTVIALNWEDAEDVKEVVKILGEVFNKPEIVEEYIKYFDETIAKVGSIISKIPEDKKVTVLSSSIQNLSLGHVISEWWIEAAGGISVSKDLRQNEQANQYSIEQLLSWDPEVIIVSSKKDLDEIYKDERFKNIKAVKNKRMHVGPSFGHKWLNRTIEQPLTVLWAAKSIYPEEFKDINMYEELKYFSKKFFRYDLSDEECKEILGDMK